MAKYTWEILIQIKIGLDNWKSRKLRSTPLTRVPRGHLENFLGEFCFSFLSFFFCFVLKSYKQRRERISGPSTKPHVGKTGGSKMSCVLETLPRTIRMFTIFIAGQMYRDDSEPSSRLLACGHWWVSEWAGALGRMPGLSGWTGQASWLSPKRFPGEPGEI